MAHGTAGYILGGFPKTAARNIQAFHAIGIVDAEIDLDQFIIDKDALDRSRDPLLAEAAHDAEEIAAFRDGPLADVNVIKQTETYPAAINGLDILIDNGLNQLVLRLIGNDGVKIVGSFFLGLDNFLGFGFFCYLSNCFLVDGYQTIGFFFALGCRFIFAIGMAVGGLLPKPCGDFPASHLPREYCRLVVRR